ncbi:hypothetical protein AB1L42_02805 [Thalassoglobus sp. JC818]|uniref:hypothetical protein n=1 Tax=Thalassoglobus sp. JC818 TaxID=3232136 RepID=UPI00345B087C
MRLKACHFLLIALLSCVISGCGEGDIPEDLPPTPEAGTDDYDQYNSAGRRGPGGGKAGNK